MITKEFKDRCVSDGWLAGFVYSLESVPTWASMGEMNTCRNYKSSQLTVKLHTIQIMYIVHYGKQDLNCCHLKIFSFHPPFKF